MGTLRFIWPLLVFTRLVCGQGVYEMTIRESRTINVAPDQTQFSFEVDAPLSSDFDAVLASVATLGVTAANLTGVSGPGAVEIGRGTQQVFGWSFSFSVPIAKAQDTLAALSALQASIARQYNGFSFSYSGGNTIVSPQPQPTPVCPVADLVSDARLKAATIATANGFTLGPIVAMSDGSSNQSAGQLPAVFFSGSFLGQALFVTPSVATPPACEVVVKFNMFRY